MDAAVAKLSRPFTGGSWLGNACLRYVNWSGARSTTRFRGMVCSALTAAASACGPRNLTLVPLRDAEDLRTLMRLYNQAYIGATDYKKAGWVQSMALGACESFDPTLVWIAVRGAEPVGFCMSRLRGSRGRITGIGVCPEHRRRKIGTRLMVHAMDELRRRGASNIHLETADADRGPQALFRKLGFHDAE